MASNFKLSDTLAYINPYLNFFPVALGSTNQPFIGMCNAVAQFMLAPPFKHNFNRASLDFVTVSGTQTYVKAQSWASGAFSAGAVIIDSNGNGQKALVAGTTGGSPPAWATGLFLTTADNTVTWQNVGPLGNILAVNNFSFIEKAYVQDINNGNEWKELGISLNLARDTTTGCPKHVSAQSDDNLGDLAIRLMPTPAGAYPVSIQYQQLQVPFTGLSSNWAPLPDRLFYTYSMGVLALAYLYKGDMRFSWASSQFVARMLAYAEGMEESQVNQFLRRWAATLSEGAWAQQAQQGTSARGQI